MLHNFVHHSTLCRWIMAMLQNSLKNDITVLVKEGINLAPKKLEKKVKFYTWITLQPYWWVQSIQICASIGSITNRIRSSGTHSMHFWITWLPFWSLIHLRTEFLSSWTIWIFLSISTTSITCQYSILEFTF
jgi:hypothetical protein